VGLNLLFELPQTVTVRKAMHRDARLREALLGAPCAWAPMVMTYDPRRVLIEVIEEDRLVITSLDLTRRIPLIRYATGDRARLLRRHAVGMPPQVDQLLVSLGEAPLVALQGRGEFAWAGQERIYVEQVKEGLYHDPQLAGQLTANFRLRSGEEQATVRLQLAPGVPATREIEEGLSKTISQYAPVPLAIRCEGYETFRTGMRLDYERKFPYLEGE
jgi:phenylacetate-CoA ligase